MRKITVCLLSLFCCAALFAAKPTLTLNQLMAMVKVKQASVKVRYIQERKLHFLKKRIRSKGEFYFKKPNTIIRYVTSPKPATFIVVNETLTVISKQVKRQLYIDHYPNLWVLVTTFRSLLKGNADFFRYYYDVTLHGQASDWQLKLVPRRYLTKKVRFLMVKGKQSNIQTMAVYFKNGDTIKQDLSKGGA